MGDLADAVPARRIRPTDTDKLAPQLAVSHIGRHGCHAIGHSDAAHTRLRPQRGGDRLALALSARQQDDRAAVRPNHPVTGLGPIADLQPGLVFALTKKIIPAGLNRHGGFAACVPALLHLFRAKHPPVAVVEVNKVGQDHRGDDE